MAEVFCNTKIRFTDGTSMRQRTCRTPRPKRDAVVSDQWFRRISDFRESTIPKVSYCTPESVSIRSEYIIWPTTTRLNYTLIVTELQNCKQLISRLDSRTLRTVNVLGLSYSSIKKLISCSDWSYNVTGIIEHTCQIFKWNFTYNKKNWKVTSQICNLSNCKNKSCGLSSF